MPPPTRRGKRSRAGAPKAGGAAPHQHQPQARKKKSTNQRIRDVQRLLRREDLAATVRVAQERMLDALQKAKRDAERGDRERKLAKKYRMVKFFEKQKLNRELKRCLRRLESQELSNADRKALAAQVEESTLRLQYVLNFPKGRKYISVLKEDDELPAPVAEQRRVLMKAAAEDPQFELENIQAELAASEAAAAEEEEEEGGAAQVFEDDAFFMLGGSEPDAAPDGDKDEPDPEAEAEEAEEEEEATAAPQAEGEALSGDPASLSKSARKRRRKQLAKQRALQKEA